MGDGELCLAGGGRRAWPHGPGSQPPPPPPPLHRASTSARGDTRTLLAELAAVLSSPSVLSYSCRGPGWIATVAADAFMALFFSFLFRSRLRTVAAHAMTQVRCVRWPGITHANHLAVATPLHQKTRPVPLARGTADAPGPHGSQTTMVQCKMKFVWVCVALAALVACRSQHMAAASAAEVSEDAGREIRSCRAPALYGVLLWW